MSVVFRSARCAIKGGLCAGALLALFACGSDDGHGSKASEQSDAGAEVEEQEQALVSGRVTDVDGKPVADAVVRVGTRKTRTDDKGRFEVTVQSDEVDEADEVQVAVDGKKYSSGAAPVQVALSGKAHVEVGVRERSIARAEVTQTGLSVKSDDGFGVQVPPGGLRTKAGGEVEGEVEVAYTLVNEPKQVTAAPGGMQTDANGALEGYGLVEVRFYQGDEELELAEEARFEFPFASDTGLDEGSKTSVFGLGHSDKRWSSSGDATVENGKLVVSSARLGWLGAARALPVDSCVSGRLLAGGDSVASTLIRAARGRGLSLVQAQTAPDGSFCLPVTPNDDWSVSTYYDDGDQGLGFVVPVNSSDAVGMCGGDGCKSVGDVELPVLEP